VSRALTCALALAALAAPASAGAHEVRLEVRPGGAVAARAATADGEPLAYAAYELWSPADPKIPWQKGRTDRDGWAAFVPAAPGAWRLRVVGADGHGLDQVIEVPAAGLAAGGAAAPGTGPGTALRPVVGLLLIAALFGGLVLLYRKRRPAP
jgi:nickel transport protein